MLAEIERAIGETLPCYQGSLPSDGARPAA